MTVEAKEYTEETVIERPADKLPEETEVEETKEEKPKNIRSEIADKYSKKFNPEPEEEEKGEDGDKVSADKNKKDDGTVEVIVNGQKILADKSKIDDAGGVENYQKTVAAHQGLKELAKQRKMLENERLLIAQEKELIKQQQNLPPAKEDDSSQEEVLTSLKEEQISLMKQYNDALYSSDEDKSVVLLQELIANGVKMSAPKQPTQEPIDQEQIINTAVDRIHKENAETAKFQYALDEAQTKFKEEYADIYNNVTAKNIANEQTKVLKVQNPDWTPMQVVMKAGEITRNIVQGLRDTGSEQDDAKERERKIADKAKRSSVKPAGIRAAAKQQPKPQTNSDYIANLRKSRGLE